MYYSIADYKLVLYNKQSFTILYLLTTEWTTIEKKQKFVLYQLTTLLWSKCGLICIRLWQVYDACWYLRILFYSVKCFVLLYTVSIWWNKYIQNTYNVRITSFIFSERAKFMYELMQRTYDKQLYDDAIDSHRLKLFS